MEKKEINIKSFNLIYSENGYPFGFELTRDIEPEEAILLVERSLGLKVNWPSEIYLHEVYVCQLTTDLENLIKGSMMIEDFIDEYAYGSNLSGGNLGSIMQLLIDMLKLDLIK